MQNFKIWLRIGAVLMIGANLGACQFQKFRMEQPGTHEKASCTFGPVFGAKPKRLEADDPFCTCIQDYKMQGYLQTSDANLHLCPGT